MDHLKNFRKETRSWLEANYPQSLRQPIKSDNDIYWGGRKRSFPNDDIKTWFERMLEKRWIAPDWPTEYGGGGLNKQENKALREEMKRLNCRLPLYSFGIWMLGPALLKFGSEEQKQKYLWEIVRGEIRWCQGYSEPNAGSDLAGLQTRAESDGDHYIVSGQKVWTSYADKSDWIFCLVRTDPQASKHTGISFLLIDMASEGVSTRPIRLISGSSPFCETFLENVRVPKSNIVGELNKGWDIAKYLLTHEREMIGGVGNTEVTKSPHQYAIESIGLENGKLADPVLRRDIAKLEADALAYQITIARSRDEAKSGQSPGAKSAFFKYYGTELNKRRYELLLAIAGSDSLAWEGEEFNDGELSRLWLRSKGNSIEGGTSEVMLNIIAKRILGLPS